VGRRFGGIFSAVSARAQQGRKSGGNRVRNGCEKSTVPADWWISRNRLPGAEARWAKKLGVYGADPSHSIVGVKPARHVEAGLEHMASHGSSQHVALEHGMTIMHAAVNSGQIHFVDQIGEPAEIVGGGRDAA